MDASWDRRAPSEQRRIQDLVLDRWVDAAAAFSPHWGEHLARADVNPARITSADRLVHVPAVRELDIRDAGGPGAPALVLRPTEEQVQERASFGLLWSVGRGIRRSGTSGKRHVLLREYKPIHLLHGGRDGRLSVAASRSDLDRLHLTGARAAAVLGLSSADYVVSALPPDGSLPWWGTYHLALGASILAVHARRGRSLGAVAAAFGRVPATAVVVRADEVVELAATLTEVGVDLRRITTVVVAGPPPSPSGRAAIADAWVAAGAANDLRVLALWAPPGARALWAECRESSGHGGTSPGLHTYPDLEVLELLDPIGRPVPDGGGDLTITTSGWHGTALIRYQTGEWVSALATDPCPACGRTVPRVVGPVVEAAWEPRLAAPGGHRRLDLRGAARVLAAAETAGRWRVEVVAGDAGVGDGYVVHLARELDPDQRAALERWLAATCGLTPRDVVTEPEEAIRARVEQVGGAFEDRR